MKRGSNYTLLLSERPEIQTSYMSVTSVELMFSAPYVSSGARSSGTLAPSCPSLSWPAGSGIGQGHSQWGDAALREHLVTEQFKDMFWDFPLSRAVACHRVSGPGLSGSPLCESPALRALAKDLIA